MKTYRAVDVKVRIVLTFGTVRGEWSASRSCRSIPGTQQTGNVSSPNRTDQSRSVRFGELTILDPTGTRSPPLGRPASSQSLYRPSYRGSPLTFQNAEIYLK
jgi:hypothetical protein